VPELPEVEHARRTLEEWMLRGHIDFVSVQDARILDDGTKPAAVVRAVTGARVVASSSTPVCVSSRISG
jgi:formamidopyrimidine-DNA glycosylase